MIKIFKNIKNLFFTILAIIVGIISISIVFFKERISFKIKEVKNKDNTDEGKKIKKRNEKYKDV